MAAMKVVERYEQGLREIRTELEDYWLNHAFHLGHQWLFWNRAANRVDQLPSDPDRIRATVNRIKADVRIIIANYTQRELIFEVHATGFDDASVRSARIGAALLRDLAFQHNWEGMREVLGYACLKGGTAAVAVDWDEDLQESKETVLSIAEFVVEPGARDAERARWWIKAEILPPGTVQAIYGLAEEPPADAVAGNSSFARRLTSGAGTSESVPQTRVLTYYERPNPLCPEGKVCVEIDGRIVFEGEWPFPWEDRLNLRLMRETPVESRWAGTTILNDVRKMQVAYNATWSNYLEHLRDAGVARLRVPSSAVDLIRQVTDQPGEILEYPDGVTPPDYLTPPQLAGWLRDMATELKNEMDDIIGVHDVSRGMAPANIESGYGVAILAEKDSSPIGRLIKESARLWTGVARDVLALYGKHRTKKSTLAVRSSVGPERHEWTGKDLDGQYEAVVPLDAILPKSMAAQQALADRMVQMGMIQDLPTYVRFAQVPGQEGLLYAAMPDVARARGENHMMALGEVAIPEDWDDHEVHIKEHNDFRKSDRYAALKDDGKRVVDMHIQGHATMAAEALGKMRRRESIDPAMTQIPNAQGTPPPGMEMAPLPEEVPMPEEVAPEEEAVDPAEMAAEMQLALEFGDPVPPS